MFPYQSLPDIYEFCCERLDEVRAEGGQEDAHARERLESGVHALRALDPDAWWQAEADIREIAGRFEAHPEYAALGLDGDEEGEWDEDEGDE
ncbi:hypothetical protein [Streptomyces sp. CBMA29]|uniref:hypothetical protein n=1 Tax=Streptomyces sp. CBMA29 TaxID=1896314 RepID=UPI001661F3D4|nr:hypothetical protein [Streptomyces sp. CBMA29]MBD0738068.1 hypothetical protein [Streptomyces sp. CBMA29]